MRRLGVLLMILLVPIASASIVAKSADVEGTLGAFDGALTTPSQHLALQDLQDVEIRDDFDTTPFDLPTRPLIVESDHHDQPFTGPNGTWHLRRITADAVVALWTDIRVPEIADWNLTPQAQVFLDESHAHAEDHNHPRYYAHRLEDVVHAASRDRITVVFDGPGTLYAWGYEIQAPDGRLIRTGSWNESETRHNAYLVARVPAQSVDVAGVDIYGDAVTVDASTAAVHAGFGTLDRYTVDGDATFRGGHYVATVDAGTLRVDALSGPVGARGAVAVDEGAPWAWAWILVLLAPVLAFYGRVLGSARTWTRRAARAADRRRWLRGTVYATLSVVLRPSGEAFVVRGQLRSKRGKALKALLDFTEAWTLMDDARVRRLVAQEARDTAEKIGSLEESLRWSDRLARLHAPEFA